MPRHNKKSIPCKNQKAIETKMALWAHCIACGWVADTTQCLHKTEGPQQTRMRLNFREDKTLTLEHKRVATKEELAKSDNPRRLLLWEVLMVGTYGKIKMVEDGVSFPLVKTKIKGVEATKPPPIKEEE